MDKSVDVQKIAKLARLKLDPEREQYFQDKFSAIKEYIDCISEVKTDNEMTLKDESYQQIFHEDIRNKTEININEFSDKVENSFFKVPRIIE